MIAAKNNRKTIFRDEKGFVQIFFKLELKLFI